MSFEKVGVAELRQVAIEFGVVLDAKEAKSMKKAELVRAIEDDGVTFDQYQQFKEMRDAAEEAETEDVEPAKMKAASSSKPMELGNILLIKMDRENFSFEVPRRSGSGVWRWTKAHPFQAMTQDEASHVLDTFAGFRIATPTEAKEYYDTAAL